MISGKPLWRKRNPALAIRSEHPTMLAAKKYARIGTFTEAVIRSVLLMGSRVFIPGFGEMY
jgi:hypothetical protein